MFLFTLACETARQNLKVQLTLLKKESYSQEEVQQLFDNLLTGIIVGIKQAKDMLDKGNIPMMG